MNTKQDAAPMESPLLAPAAPSTDHRATQKRNRESLKQARRIKMAAWVPHQSTPYRMETFELKSESAQYVYYLGLVMAQKSLYFFYYTLPDNHEAVRAAETVVRTKIDTVVKAINEEVERLKALLADALADDLDGYTKPFKIKVAIYTPEAARIGNAVRQFDHLVDLADRLWFSGDLTKEQRGRLVFKYRVMIIGLARNLYLLSRQAKSAVVRQRNAHAKEREAKVRAKALAQAESHTDESPAEPTSSEDADVTRSSTSQDATKAETETAAEKTTAKATPAKKAARKTASVKKTTGKDASAEEATSKSEPVAAQA